MRAAIAALLLAACVDGPGDPLPLPRGDLESFAERVQPELSQGCSNPACHGAPKRPLELYAPRMHRLDPERLYLDEPLSDEELRRNHDRARSFVNEHDPPASALLTEPLDPRAGGTAHGGGVQWGDELEPGYQIVLSWIEDAADQGAP